jgi:hypothetical protein
MKTQTQKLCVVTEANFSFHPKTNAEAKTVGSNDTFDDNNGFMVSKSNTLNFISV